MIVNLIKSNRMFSLNLPEKKKGQFWLKDIDFGRNKRNLISIEAIQDEWVAKSNKNVTLLDKENRSISKLVIQPGVFIDLKIGKDLESAIMYADPETEGIKVYTKYLLNGVDEIQIGRSTQSDILIQNNRYVSNCHAFLKYIQGNWIIEDKGSRNGTYVNGYRVNSQKLYPGDCVYIMGFRMILGYNFIAINNPRDGVSIINSKIQKIKVQEVREIGEPVYNYENKEYFYKSPRFKRDISQEEIVLDAPPAAEKVERVPLALMLGPSVTMGMASVGTASISVINVMSTSGDFIRAVPSVIMAGSMILGSVFWPVLTKKNEKKQKIRNEQKRQEKYLQYLNQVRDDINRLCLQQSEILKENGISIDECISRIRGKSSKLWERTIYQNDFLTLRLGIGNIPLKVKMDYQKKKFSMEDDNLLDRMVALGREEKELENVPITVSFVENFIAGIVGEHAITRNFLKMLIIQMAALFGYDELKIVLITNENEEEEWNFIRVIPHFWNNERTVRYFASTADEKKELSAVLEKSIAERKDGCDRTENLPYYVILSTSRESMNSCLILEKLFGYKNNSGFSILCMGETLNDIPINARNVILLKQNEGELFDKNDTSGNHQKFIPDKININELEAVSMILGNMELDVEAARYTLPNMLTFLEMFGVGKIEHLNPLTRWKENNPTTSLQTPVGVSNTGDEFMLDLHERYHGPHGLVAGMTGSGKSEFIITYILSMAVNYHPDEVAFVLIDYKGGGLADAFENKEKGIKLPHLAGTITNLDGASITRALVSIESELKRRETLFKEARMIANEGTMDIYEYQKLYRSGVLKKPLPHLFIISDEFAELKAQQPEFMDQLISTARIGRSLGVHLILATQKPNGVVNDQIWSNSKFKICLKVQEKADSQDMIKRPDAAELVQTGRFYLLVGFNELFAMGQSAWCGADYIPTENVEKTSDTSIQVIDKLGRIIESVKLQKKNDENKAIGKQIVKIVEYISEQAKEEGIAVEPLWLSPISDKIYIRELEKKYDSHSKLLNLNPIVGEYDNPYEQKQEVLTVPFSKEGNCIVYGAAGNGKTTFLTAMIYSLLRHHTAREINIYIMDFGAETLKTFESAPQVGGVALVNDSEKINNLFKLISSELKKRKKLFSEFGGDFAGYCKHSENILPNILVVINNYAVFSEEYASLAEQLVQISRECVKYGIYFTITTTMPSTVSIRVAQNFKLKYTMQMNDSSLYSIVVGKTYGLIPMQYKGRGLIELSRRVYEFQTAYCEKREDIQKYLKQYCLHISKTAGSKAREIPVLPDIVRAETVKKQIKRFELIPYGIHTDSLKTLGIRFEDKCIYPIASYSTKNLQDFAVEFVKVLVLSDIAIEVWDSGNFLKEQIHDYQYVGSNYGNVVEKCFYDLLEKDGLYVDSGKNTSVLDKYSEKIILIIGIQKILSTLNEDQKDMLTSLLEKNKLFFKTRFILIDTMDQYQIYQLQSWYSTHINGTFGLWIGDDIANQSLFKIGKIDNYLREEITGQYGYAIDKMRPRRIKIVTVCEGEEDII
ncbi:MAG: type VII secretion protein EssC [Lachnospiraceae bacterium]